MPSFMTEWWHGMFMGAVFVFVFWCIHEAVIEYRFNRDMEALNRSHALRMGHFNWLYRHRKVKPLFHEQGEDDA